MNTSTSLPSYRDWSDINIEREYREICEAIAAVPYARFVTSNDDWIVALRHRQDLLEYEIFDRGLEHLYPHDYVEDADDENLPF